MIGALLLAAALATPVEPRPDWCKPGYACIKTSDAAALTVKLIDLEAENAELRLRRAHHWGFAAVCGPSASLVVQNGKADFSGTVSCTIGPGFRW